MKAYMKKIDKDKILQITKQHIEILYTLGI
jgi:hypothetical protein